VDAIKGRFGIDLLGVGRKETSLSLMVMSNVEVLGTL
jgi:hypothetical protein